MNVAAAIPHRSRPLPSWVRVMLIMGRVLLGVIFLVGAFERLHFNGRWHFHDYSFYSALRLDSYGTLPVWIILPITPILPWLEIILGVSLIAGVFLRWGGLVAATLLALFNYMLVVGEVRVTGDGFAERGSLAPGLLVRDCAPLALALAVTIGAFLMQKQQSKVSS